MSRTVQRWFIKNIWSLMIMSWVGMVVLIFYILSSVPETQDMGSQIDERLPYKVEQNGKGLPQEVTERAINNEESQTYLEDSEAKYDMFGSSLFGEMGKPTILVNVTFDVKKLIRQGYKYFSYNQYVSDQISVHRSLPDIRDPWCKKKGRYLKKLPATSVVIPFRNEAWSVLLRTVHSVLDRSPPYLIKEIILVDDFSDMIHLKIQLEEYVAMLPKTRIVRTNKREGLIRTRMFGAKIAKGPVITFLDSHCECTPGWLEPLLDAIARNSSTVACPYPDNINEADFRYDHDDIKENLQVSGFSWDLDMTWHFVKDRLTDRRTHHAEPADSPSMVGGQLSIHKDFWEKIGTYDPGFEIWGAENFEISLKAWMCGGSVKMIPCSRVGHVYKKGNHWLKGKDYKIVWRNYARLIEVWMEEYKEKIFDRIGWNLTDIGDVTERRLLRDRLKCNSFQWYINNVFPELTTMDEVQEEEKKKKKKRKKKKKKKVEDEYVEPESTPEDSVLEDDNKYLE